MPPISRDTVVIGTAPRMSLLGFKAALDVSLSPARFEATTAYNAIIAEGVDPAFILSLFRRESQYATDPKSIVVKYKTFSPGNTRSSTIGTMPLVSTDRGIFVKYDSWETGFRDMAHRLVAKDFVYAQEGRVTISQIIERWAPKGDQDNDPDGYINAVISLMNSWTGSSTEVTSKMALKIALSAGHHNSDGGSPVEAAITGPLCHFYAMAFRELGCDVRVITPNDGLGQFPGGLQDVAAKIVEWSNAGWVADLYLETHTQGLGDTSVRGAFAIYPDWVNDIDLVVKNGLGLTMVKAISAATGIPVWSSGLMSEKSTGVGISGFRLGIFLRTAPVASDTTRLIIEHGSHSNPQDLAILQNPEMQQRIANAGAKAATDYLIGIHGPRPINDPCMDYFNSHGGEAVFGKPVGGQFGTSGSIQREFEFASMYLDQLTKMVVARMKDRTNPQGFKVGTGIYGKCKELGLRLIVGEQWFSPDPNQPGLGKMSRAWAQDKDGVTVVLMASELIELAKPGQDTPWKVEVLEVK
jgi:N-acetylmuramoyl-L-alanine amidase